MNQPTEQSDAQTGAAKPSLSTVQILVITVVAAIVFALAGWYVMPLYYDMLNQREVDATNAWLRGEGPPPKGNNFLFTPAEMDKFREEYRQEQKAK